MQNVDDDMDDLFTRAAADYPLSTEESNWDSIRERVSKAVQAPLADKKKGRNRKRFFLLLLPVFICGGMLWYSSQPIFRKDVYHQEKKTHQLTIQYNGKNHLPQKKGNNHIDTLSGTNKKAAMKPVFFGTEPIAEEHTRHPDNRRWKNRLSFEKKRNHIRNLILEEQPADQRSHETAIEYPVPDQPWAAMRAGGRGVHIQQITKQVLEIRIDALVVYKEKGDNLSQMVIADILTSKRSYARPGFRQSQFVLGVMAGPDLVQVKSGLHKAGLTAGLIGGYQVNKNLSIETAVLYSRKNYFSQGESFSMKKIQGSMPTGMELLTVKGDIFMLELPLTVNYDFVKKKRSAFFLSSGFSSYVLMRETNVYTAMVNGNYETMKGEYRETSLCGACTLNLSVGYEHSLGGSYRFRIEPTAKFPVRGIGMGSLPVRSLGLYAELLKDIR